MIIEVAPYHITTGVPKDDEFCPIAIAVTQQVPGAQYVSVEEDVIELFLEDDEDKRVIPLPRSARRFIQAFDKRRDVSPFNFRLNLGSLEPYVAVE